jgi:hypothetical protein
MVTNFFHITFNDLDLDYGACGPKTKNGLIQFYPDLFAEEDFLLNIDA